MVVGRLIPVGAEEEEGAAQTPAWCCRALAAVAEFGNVLSREVMLAVPRHPLQTPATKAPARRHHRWAVEAGVPHHRASHGVPPREAAPVAPC